MTGHADGERNAALSEQSYSPDDRVLIDAPGAWFHGLTGTVVELNDDVLFMWTVQPDDPGEPRALVRTDELRRL